MNQEKMPIVDKLEKYKKLGRISMHIPGHKGMEGINVIPEFNKIFGENVLECDITEIDGFDDFHKAEGIILEARRLAAELFGGDDTYFLTNGTTSGIMAAIASVANEGEFILVARDSHKSVMRGIVLSGAQPIYINPVIDDINMLTAGLSNSEVKMMLENNREIKGLVLSNPSYYGTYSDLRSIVKIAHEYGIVVIVDEAHGAHIQFTEQNNICSAMFAGADICVQSTHKMLGSLTQSAMLHVKGDLVNQRRLEYNIGFMTSTSPSYLLLASLDAVRHRMAANGNKIWRHVQQMVAETINNLSEIKGIKCVSKFKNGQGILVPIENCRLIISALEMGISGGRLADLLLVDYSIDVEFADDLYIIAVCGSGTKKSDLQAMENALKDISNRFYSGDINIISEDIYCEEIHTDGNLYNYKNDEEAEKGYKDTDIKNDFVCDGKYKTISAGMRAILLKYEQKITPRQAINAAQDVIDLRYAEGRIAASEVAVYPPGIPILQPGELISEDIRDLILSEFYKGAHIHGIKSVHENGERRAMIAVSEDDSQAILFNILF